MSLFKRLVLLALVNFFCGSAIGLELTGKVVRVADGDTVTLRSEGGQDYKIRLEGIDCPESNQDFGQKATSALSKKISGRSLRAKVSTRDRYGRYVATLFLDGDDINAWMVAQGWAWHYKKYSKDPGLGQLEQQARSQNLGLWADPSSIAPWEFRSLQRQAKAVKSGAAVPTGYWLNTSSNTRHNSTCKWHQNTKRGRKCTANEGNACGICGG